MKHYRMKHSETTKIFVIVWASVLFASYVTGKCIKEVRFKRARIASQAVIEPEVSSEVQRPSEADKLVQELAQRSPMSGPRGAERPGNRSPEDRAGFGEGRGNMREGFANMSEEERAKMREEMEMLREQWEEMSEEEREEARAKISEKYGFVPRIRLGGREGGGEGGRRRPGGRRQENN